jgi:hypothetical protein
VQWWHERILEFTRRPDAVFLVRSVTGLERRVVAATASGDLLMPTDNSPGWWMHFITFNGIRDAEFADVPVHMHDIGRCLPTHISRAGWHVAHILDAKDRNVNWRSWSRPELIRRFVRNLHPCNLFYIPKVDWAPYGRDPAVIAYFAVAYAERYGAVWQDFLTLARGQPPRATEVPRYRYPLLDMPARERPKAAATSAARSTTYEHARLCFKADVIEPLAMEGMFRVVTPNGTFRMTKAEFYLHFPNVVASNSYRRARIYHYPTTPARANRFLE